MGNTSIRLWFDKLTTSRSGQVQKLLVISGIIFCLFSPIFAYSGGSGTETAPYQIANVSDLLELAADANDYNDCFILINDINMAGQVFTKAIIAADTSSSSGFQGTAFTGAFDGNGRKITNFTINGGSNDYLGLFGEIDSGGSVKNLGLENFSVSGSIFVGGLVGDNYSGSISNCYATGAVSGSSDSYYVGGLVGDNGYNGIIRNCYSTGTVSGSGIAIGGLVGWNGGGTIVNCYATGAVTGDGGVGGLVGRNNSGSISDCYSTGGVSGSQYVGGLVGYNYDGSISNCYATGTISGFNDSRWVGGLVGWNSYGSISNCYSTGTVSGSDRVGGLVGLNYIEGSISNCYSTGGVSGSSSIGGLAGRNYYECSISSCYSTGAVSGSLDVGGLVGSCDDQNDIITSFWDIEASGQTDGIGNVEPDPNGVTGLPTSQMQEIDTYVSAGWDFDYDDGDEADWFIQIDEYPILVWQISPADIYTDGRNDFRDFAVFAQFWMRDDCAIYNYYCDWADLDFNGSVDIDDLAILMDYWLEKGIY